MIRLVQIVATLVIGAKTQWEKGEILRDPQNIAILKLNT